MSYREVLGGKEHSAEQSGQNSGNEQPHHGLNCEKSRFKDMKQKVKL